MEHDKELRIFIAGLESPPKIELAKKHEIPYWLVSLHTLEGKGEKLDKILLNKPEDAELFLDNGCFAVQNQMKESRQRFDQSEFDVLSFTEDYIDLLKRKAPSEDGRHDDKERHEMINHYPVADPPFDEGEKQSRLALQMMEEEGLNPAPVWHLDWSMEYLKQLCRDHDFICLGGIASEDDTRQQKEAFLPILNHCKKTGTKAHVFGVTSPKFMKWFKGLAYSVDSTTWSYGGRARKTFITGPFFDGQFEVFDFTDMVPDDTRPMTSNYQIDDYNMERWKEIIRLHSGGGLQ